MNFTLSLVFISTFCLMISAFPSPKKDRAADKKPIGFEDYISFKFGARSFNGTWINDNEFTFYNGPRDFVKFNMETTDTDIVIPKAILDLYQPDVIRLNSDGSKALLRYESRKLFRHSIIAKFVVIDITSTDFTSYHIFDKKELQNCIWSPSGDAVAYVFDNNVYHEKVFNNEAPSQLTFDGKENDYFNGIADWVYEEEVFGDYNALWFSPDGQKLAFGYFEDDKVKKASYFIYNEVKTGETGEKIEGQYTETIRLSYPKAGTTNPIVKVKIVDLENLEVPTKIIEPPTATLNEPILSSVNFVDNELISVMWRNRRQDKAEVKIYDLEDLANIQNFVQTEKDGWIDAEKLICHEDNKCFIQRNENGWASLVLVDRSTANTKSLTPEKITVLQFLGWNPDQNEAYVIATGNTGTFKDSAIRQLYAIQNIENDKPDFKCLSCEIKSPEGETCTYVALVRFSEKFKYFSLTCSGPNPAYNIIIENSKRDEPASYYEWEMNENLRETMKEYLEPKIEWYSVPVGPNGEYDAIVKCKMPECLNADETKKYSMIVDVYGGPGSVRALWNFGINFGDYMAQTRNAIYCNIDGRGSGNKGTKMLFELNNRLGTVEIEDQIQVTKHLIENEFKDFVDPKRVGIWGWSYGGYATGMVLVRDNQHVFQGGISVAPVSDWVLYDTIYTERFMGLPTKQDNLNGYQTANLTSFAKNMKGHEYLLIHGNADDNVHYGNAMVWAKALELEVVMFEQQSYPDEDHSLSRVSRHLYHTMDEFWHRILKFTPADAECLKK